MKIGKKAFTLVELIVVITILAVLATVAFISLTGYSQDAKNSKVQSDIRTLVSAIEAKMTKDGTTASNLVDWSYALANDNAALPILRYKSGASAIAMINKSNYTIWWVDFPTLWQSSDDFVTSEWNQYLLVWVDNFYQVAGETMENWVYTAVVKWNYVDDWGPLVVESLFTINGSSKDPLMNNYSSGSTNLY